jgi:beta-lactam-binding protein with PASTA domain
MVSTIENHLGRNVEEVRIDLLTMPLVAIRNPIMYEFSHVPAGTVIHQHPEPGTNISGPVMLELVVSRGPENLMIRLPDLLGLNIEETLEQIGHTGIDFEFSLRSPQAGEAPGTVVAQSPAGDTLVPLDTRVAITMTFPGILFDNEVFGLFVFDMPRNPYPLLVRLDSIHPNGEQQRLLSVHYAGRRLTVPYIQPAGSVLVLYMINREIHRESVSSLVGLPIQF